MPSTYFLMLPDRQRERQRQREKERVRQDTPRNGVAREVAGDCVECNIVWQGERMVNGICNLKWGKPECVASRRVAILFYSPRRLLISFSFLHISHLLHCLSLTLSVSLFPFLSLSLFCASICSYCLSTLPFFLLFFYPFFICWFDKLDKDIDLLRSFVSSSSSTSFRLRLRLRLVSAVALRDRHCWQ